MEAINLREIRSALLESEILTERDLSQISDETLKTFKFQEDLAMDSLDCLVFLRNLEGGERLSTIGVKILDCKTMQDLLNLSIS